MKDFAATRGLEQEEDLLAVLYRPKSYCRFKDKVYDLGIEEEYLAFHRKYLLKIAKEWCEEHQIAYEE